MAYALTHMCRYHTNSYLISHIQKDKRERRKIFFPLIFDIVLGAGSTQHFTVNEKILSILKP